MNRAQPLTELVGRTRLVNDVTAVITDRAGFGALLMGEPGVGKTAVARAVVTRLRWTAPVITVTGGPSLRSIPFGALAPYLHTLSVADAESPVAILRAVMEHLSAGATGKTQHPPLLVVDDAHELDDSSSALLAQLVSARRAKVLVMSRDVPTAPSDFTTLSGDGLLARFDLEPLDADAVSLMCRQVLGGPVLTGTSQALNIATGGNPMFLRTVLERGEAEGYLERRNGVWRLTAGQGVMHLQLGDLIRARLRSRSVEEIAALELVALAEPIALGTVATCIDPPVLARLREDRLIAVGLPPDETVSLEQPLYGEVLRAQVPAARSMAIRRTVLAALDSRTQSLEGFLRFVSWGLDCGAAPDDDTLLTAATVANSLRDHDFALRAASAVTAPALRGRALTQFARVEAGRGNIAYAQELVAEALTRCTDAHVAEEATLLSFELSLATDASFEDLRADVARWRSIIEGLETGGTAERPGLDPVDTARARLGFRLLESNVRILEGAFHGVENSLRSIIEDPACTPELHVGALVLLAELLGSMGRSVEGSAHSARALEMIEADTLRLLRFREVAVARHVFLLVNSGRGLEAREVLETLLSASPRSTTYFAGWSDIVAGLGALRGARNVEARDRLLLALEALRDSDATKFLTLLTGIAAYAAALAGDPVRAAELIEEFDRTTPRGSRSMRLAGKVFVTAASALLGDTPTAGAALVALARTAAADGMKEASGTAFRLALMLGDTSVVGPLLRVLDGFEGVGADDLRMFLKALELNDVDAMIDVAQLMGERGNTSFEFAGLSMALQLLGDQRSDRRMRAVKRRLVTLGEQREGPVPLPLATASPAPTTASLTPTERKIVGLVRDGYSNREIAEAKSVSVRTVEGHLYRVFAKLGVNRREDLREP